MFDSRICEMSDYKATMLAPIWDCKTLLNVNGFDLWPEMKTAPAVHGAPTEALFAVVRSELGDFVRHSAFHLDFLNPMFKSIAKDVQHGPVPEGGELVTLEKLIQDKYLQFCNPENPLHFMTLWTARGYLAKSHLVEYYSQHSKSSTPQTDAQRDVAIDHALSMLECDTQLMTSPLTKGYRWFIHFQFPFPAYIHIVQDLRRRPVGELSEKTWDAMSDNYETRFLDRDRENDDNPFFKIFSRIVLQAWAAREAVSGALDEPIVPPRIVSHIRHIATRTMSNAQLGNVEQANGAVGMNNDEFSMPMAMDFGRHGPLYGIGEQKPVDSVPGSFPEVPDQNPREIDVNQWDWNAIDWTSMRGPGW